MRARFPTMAGVDAMQLKTLLRRSTLSREGRQIAVSLALGIVDGENVNVDAILSQLRIQAQRGTATANLPLIGPVTFGLSDVDALERYIKGA